MKSTFLYIFRSVENDDNDVIVKIGDFGLAREIYSNDYYKQGKFLL